MKEENKELLTRVCGMIDGLFYQAPKEIQDALEVIGNILDGILSTESENKK